MRERGRKRNHTQKAFSLNRRRSSKVTLESSTDQHSIRSSQGAEGNEAASRIVPYQEHGTDGAVSVIAPFCLGHDFSQIPVYSRAPVGVQPQLLVNTRGDVYEQEADRVAEQLDRADGGASAVAAPRAMAGGLSAWADAPVQSALHGPGEALPGQTRAYFENRLGHDFGNVRVHSDAAATKAVRAHAFTVGSDIVFGAGEYQAGTREGRMLLAHELTHVVQQGAAPSGLMQRKPDTAKKEPGTALRETSPATDDKSKTPPSVKSEVTSDAGFKILKDAFGALKKDVSKGDVKVLSQAEVQIAYDKIYGETKYSWDKYIKPTFGNIRGFAHQGVNYINKDAASLDVGTVVHEMLHSNTAGDWRGVVGHQFDEGATEYLTVFAMKKAGEPRASAYEKQLDIVNAVVGAGLADADVKTAYLLSGAQRLVADWFTEAMASTWADFKADMENEDYTKAKVKIKKKASGVEKK